MLTLVIKHDLLVSLVVNPSAKVLHPSFRFRIMLPEVNNKEEQDVKVVQLELVEVHEPLQGPVHEEVGKNNLFRQL